MSQRLAHIAPPALEAVRLTIPAREALERAGNPVAPAAKIGDYARYAVSVVRPPPGLLLVLVGNGAMQHRGLRLDTEPEYPGEWPGGSGVAWYERGQLTPCPECGHALVWCEAGYVPGWRICLAGHACQLSADGRDAERHPGNDIEIYNSWRE